MDGLASSISGAHLLPGGPQTLAGLRGRALATKGHSRAAGQPEEALGYPCAAPNFSTPRLMSPGICIINAPSSADQRLR
jgi:hypothetical protein